ncbi:unnamed protein product [Lathyrus oleraceus]
MEELEKMNFSEDLYTDVGKPFNGKNMKNMLMISKCVDLEVLDRECISTRRVEIEDYPYFTKLDPPYVLMDYMKSCLEDGIDPMVDTHNMSLAPPEGSHRSKRRSKKSRERPSMPPPPTSLTKQEKKSETFRRILMSEDDAEGSREQNKDAEKESAQESPNQNPSKSSNA